MTVNVGDVVRWTWTDGAHTTTSTTIPAGAATWNSSLGSNNTSFDYTVTVAGTYNYKCTPHEAMGMVGSFTAAGTTGVGVNNTSGINIFPNPFTDFITISSIENINSVEIFDLTGGLKAKYNLNDSSTEISKRIDLSSLHSGVYITVINSDKKKGTYKLVKR
jgi:hypothetical protein